LLEKDEDKSGINCKKKAKNKSPMIERGIKERNHRLGSCKKTLRKAMWKQKKKKWKGMKMPIMFRRGKRGFNWEKTYQMSKVNTRKILSYKMSFGIHDKAYNAFELLD